GRANFCSLRDNTVAVVGEQSISLWNFLVMSSKALIEAEVDESGVFPTYMLELHGEPEESIASGAVVNGDGERVYQGECCPSGKAIATGDSTGQVKVWDIAFLASADPWPAELHLVQPASLAGLSFMAHDQVPVTRIIWLSDTTLLTAAKGNTELKVWGLGTREAPTHTLLQTLSLNVPELDPAAPLLLEMEPSGAFLVAADAGTKMLVAIHISSVRRLDHLTCFSLMHPVLSCVALSAPAEQADTSADELEVQICCLQTKPVQIYRFYSSDATPPEVLAAAPETMIEAPAADVAPVAVASPASLVAEAASAAEAEPEAVTSSAEGDVPPEEESEPQGEGESEAEDTAMADREGAAAAAAAESEAP
ncbi:unnamed protein product, partial [Chrysoparadoxa australica]